MSSANERHAIRMYLAEGERVFVHQFGSLVA